MVISVEVMWEGDISEWADLRGWIGGEVLGSPSAEQALADQQFQSRNYRRQDNFKKGGPARMEG